MATTLLGPTQDLALAAEEAADSSRFGACWHSYLESGSFAHLEGPGVDS